MKCGKLMFFLKTVLRFVMWLLRLGRGKSGQVPTDQTSPTAVIQEDTVKPFRKIRTSSVAVDGEAQDETLHRKLDDISRVSFRDCSVTARGAVFDSVLTLKNSYKSLSVFDTSNCTIREDMRLKAELAKLRKENLELRTEIAKRQSQSPFPRVSKSFLQETLESQTRKQNPSLKNISGQFLEFTSLKQGYRKFQNTNKTLRRKFPDWFVSPDIPKDVVLPEEDSLTKDELFDKMTKLHAENICLNMYVDEILLMILENNPSLLEVQT